MGNRGYEAKKCRKCGKVATYQAGVYGYCKEHKIIRDANNYAEYVVHAVEEIEATKPKNEISVAVTSKARRII